MADLVCEVEYIIASDAAKEVVWLWKFLGELGVLGIALLDCYKKFWKEYTIRLNLRWMLRISWVPKDSHPPLDS